jgi:hypothetical protein
MHTYTEIYECDQCYQDISTGRYWRFVLSSLGVRVVRADSAEAEITQEKPLNRDHHFCDSKCLSEWLRKRMEAPKS